MDIGNVCVKSRSDGDTEMFLYVLAGLDKESKPYYGRVVIASIPLSQIC
jgi:hypothetical protein